MRVRCDRIILGAVKQMLRKFVGNSMFRFVLLLIITQFSTALAAQGLEYQSGARPNPSGAATLVNLGVYLMDIDDIDDANQQFSVDVFVNLGWHDPRLALPENERVGQNRAMPMDAIWTPRGLITNDRGLRRMSPLIAYIDDLGNVTHRQRMSGKLAVAMELKKFPFDMQRLPIDIISYLYSPDEVRFLVNTDIKGDAGSFSAAGWRLKILEPEYGELTIPAAGVVRPRVTYLIEAQRNAKFYLLTMFLPMSLIVFMSWSVFWLQPDIVPARIGLSTASIFSLLALGFSIRLGLPAVSHMTRADVFVIGCTLLVFVALGVAVVGSRWASSGRMENALRLNAVARWVYVGLFGLVSTIALTL